MIQGRFFPPDWRETETDTRSLKAAKLDRERQEVAGVGGGGVEEGGKDECKRRCPFGSFAMEIKRIEKERRDC